MTSVPVEMVRHGLARRWRVTGEQVGGRFALEAPFDVGFARARMVDVDFSGLRFGWFLAYDSVFEGCDFTRATFERPLLGSTTDDPEWDLKAWPVTVYRNCVFRRTRLPDDTHFGNARFENCLFDGARMRRQTSTEVAQFVDCVFRGKLNDVRFHGRPDPASRHDAAVGRTRNDFTGNDFTGADIVYADFPHVDLRAQRWPGPPGHALLDRIDRRVAAALAAPVDWPDADTAARVREHLMGDAAEAVTHNDGYALVSHVWIGRWLPPDLRERIFRLLVDYSDDQQ